MIQSAPDEAERKQVTVLFADVMGSMDLAEQQDPEEWRKIMQRFFSILSAAVERFEGTVDKFTGDGIMAVFGAPLAHEDHAVRACHCALEMLENVSGYAAELRREAGFNFSIRVGIDSGEVVTGEIGGEDGQYTAIGHTVGLAQRMEALAEPGKAYLTEHAAQLVEGFLELENLGEFAIKGASRPVEVFELVGIGPARSRLDLSRERGFSRFVGRAGEMAALEEALGRAKDGAGAMIAIVAEPGVGKSRLCHEFAERCRREGIDVFEAQAQSHGHATPYMPVLQMLRAYFGITEEDSSRVVREKVAGRALLLDPDLGEDLTLLFDFLGVADPDLAAPPMSPEARQRALGQIVRRLINAPNRHHTMVAVIEDLHWLDQGSEALLSEMIASIEGTRTLAVVNFRPEYRPAWEKSSDHRQLSLQPLGPADTRELLRDLAGQDASLDGLEEPIHERTMGNPFFVEEIVRELAEAGQLAGERGAYRLIAPIDGAIPRSVQAVLAARIDRLDPASKRLLQVASVLGKEVGRRALVITAKLEEEKQEVALSNLIEAGFLYRAQHYPEVLAFRHPLTREVAYNSQLAERRAATHTAAARATVELEPDRLDELSALIAHHFELGNERLEAARWSARAAHWAGHHRPQDALRMWQKVTELVSNLEEDEETAALAVLSRMLQLDYAWRLGMDRSAAESLAEEAAEIATRMGDLRSLALLRVLASARPGVAERADEWVAAATDAIQLADQSGDRGLRVAIRGAGAYALMCAGDIGGLEQRTDEMLELAADDGRLGAGIVIGCPLAWGLMAKAVALRERDRAGEAKGILEQALRLAAEHDDPETESWGRGSMASLLVDRGESEAALALALRNCELTDRLGDVFSRCLALSNLAYVQLEMAQHGMALESVETADRLYREAMGAGGEAEGWRRAMRARALLGLDRASEAIGEAQSAAQTARQAGMLWQLPPALHVLAQAQVATGSAGAQRSLEEAIEISERHGHRMALRRIQADREYLIGASRA